MTTEYRDIQGFPGYRVGSDGSVWTEREQVRSAQCRGFVTIVRGRWRRLKGVPINPGHLRLSLCDGSGGVHPRWIHRLVLEAFVGPCPPGMECRHFPDRDPANNSVENLQWGTKAENSKDSTAHCTKYDTRGEQHGMAKIDEAEVREIRRRFDAGEPRAVIARDFGLSVNHVTRIGCRGSWKHVA